MANGVGSWPVGSGVNRHAPRHGVAESDDEDPGRYTMDRIQFGVAKEPWWKSAASVGLGVASWLVGVGVVVVMVVGPWGITFDSIMNAVSGLHMLAYVLSGIAVAVVLVGAFIFYIVRAVFSDERKAKRGSE